MEVGSKYYDNYLVHVLKWSKPQEEIMPSHTGNIDKSCRKYIPEGLKLLLQFREYNKERYFLWFLLHVYHSDDITECVRI